MTEPTIDEKIELLVRSVLAAVDQRLNDVRDELHAMAADVERRHQLVLQQLQDIDRRIDHTAVETRPTTGGPDPLAVRMEQATQVLLERIEAMHQRNTMATNERFAQLNATIDQLRGVTTGQMPATTASPLGSLDSMNAPLRMPPITSQQPIITAPTPVVPSVAPSGAALDDSAATSASGAADAADAAEGEIDFNQLADLLSERLGHLSLPPRPN